MIIKAIVIRDCTISDPTYWIAEAWDEHTIDENPDGFAADLMGAERVYQPHNVRVLDIKIPEGTLAKAFDAPQVEGEIT